jgi:PPOX class probable F420-dependent enzyme
MAIDPVAERFLREHTRTFLITLRPDGAPTCHPMVALWRSGALWLNTYRKSAKARNIAEDPRVACVVVTNDDAVRAPSVVLRGHAEIVAAETLPREPGAAAAPVSRDVTQLVQARLAEGKRVLIRITPDEVRLVGTLT